MAMRTGKSRVVIDLLQERECKKVLVVCPSSVVDVWPGQFDQFSRRAPMVLPLRKGAIADRQSKAFRFIHGMGGQSVRRLHAVIVNYEAVWREPFAKWALAQEWDALVCDEIHRCKSASGKASRFLGRLGSRTPLRIGLTGTPFHHEVFDIWGQYRVLAPEIYGNSFVRFKHRYGNWVDGAPFPLLNKKEPYLNQGELMEKFRQIAFTVDASVLNLPDPTFTPIGFDLAAKGQKVYRELENDFYAEVEEGTLTAANAMVKALRLQQIAGGFSRTEEGDYAEVDQEKQKVLADLLHDINEPVVVFCRFRHDLDSVHDAVSSLSRTTARVSLELSGRVNELERWQQGKAQVLSVQIQAGGVGVDLSRARLAIYYSMGLSLGDYEQSLARMQAKGQDHSIGYYYLLANGTVDWKIYNAMRDRKEVIEELMRRS